MIFGYSPVRCVLVLLIAAILGLAASARLFANTSAVSLSHRTLVVYDSTRPDSESVARYYAAARSIPDANLCAIATSSPVWLTYAEFTAGVLSPVRTCLN